MWVRGLKRDRSVLMQCCKRVASLGLKDSQGILKIMVVHLEQ
jgi:hypothetical protein